MEPNITVLERAFQLARSGICRNVSDIKRKLSSEGYQVDAVTGGALLKQLRGIILNSGAR
jgi:hypothetical protein